jgi:uncharacterized Fe-S cluster-containing protein
MTEIMECEKYNKILKVLRESKPVLDSTEDIEKEVIKRISKVRQPIFNFSEAIDSLFGWVYIGWVRRTLITASVLLVMVFIYQQGVMFKQINFLSRQIIDNGGEMQITTEQQVEKLLMTYKKSGRGFSSRNITLSEKQIKELLDSVNDVKTKYKDLMDIIQKDPELKKLYEDKLIENNRTKIKL